MISHSSKPLLTRSNNMDLKALLVTQGVAVATCLSAFVAARELAPVPSASSPSTTSSSSLCSRALASTLWAAALAFYSLMADAWPAYKTFTSLFAPIPLRDKLLFFLMVAPVAPLYSIYAMSRSLFTTLRFRQIHRISTNPERGPDTMSMSNKIRRVIDNILVILFGINQSPGFLKRTRIVATSYIVLGMSHSTKLRPSFFLRADDETVQIYSVTDHSVNENNVADVLTLGQKTDENSCLMTITEKGKLALLDSSILPNYKQLRFLDRRSGTATLILAVQAIGYLTSIVYRAIHHLPVSPIEAIGFAFSMLVVVHSLVHSVGGVCQNPLVIYLNPAQEQELYNIEISIELSSRWSAEDEVNCLNVGLVGMVVVGSVVVAFTILVEWHVLTMSWLDAIGPILFLLSLIIQLVVNLISFKCLPGETACKIIFLGAVMISFGGIVVSILATIVNWKTNKFDIRTPSVIHNLPFLG